VPALRHLLVEVKQKDVGSNTDVKKPDVEREDHTVEKEPIDTLNKYVKRR